METQGLGRRAAVTMGLGVAGGMIPAAMLVGNVGGDSALLHLVCGLPLAVVVAVVLALAARSLYKGAPWLPAFAYGLSLGVALGTGEVLGRMLGGESFGRRLLYELPIVVVVALVLFPLFRLITGAPAPASGTQG